MATFRLTGAVHSITDRPWSSNDGKRSGVTKQALIALSPFTYTEVKLDDQLAGLTVGEAVDLMCHVEASGNFLRARAVMHWPSEVEQDAPQLKAVAGK